MADATVGGFLVALDATVVAGFALSVVELWVGVGVVLILACRAVL